MKRIKIFILMLTIILLSGCSVEYNLTINEDSSVNERVVAKEVTNRMKAKTGLSEEQSINYLYEMFDRTGLKTSISSKKEVSTTIATVSGSHSSLEKYKNNFTSDVFNKVKVLKNKNNVTIEFDQSQKLSSTAARGLVYDDITINITVPFKVIKHNADRYKNDTYTWDIKTDEDLRKIKITYDETNLKNAKTIKFGKFKFNVKYSFIAVGIIALVVIGIVIVVYHNNKKNNRI